ncbi:MAG: hypothetical protein K1000chlam1_00763 [Candidatus Anoxychlamydiales bacterium]|nr:hypothetical protein [Candidatus Anoxychlamydiales bacterium]
MRKKFISIILIVSFTFFSTNIHAQTKESDRINAEAAASGTTHATAMSMLFWGVLIVTGMALAAILIDSSTAHSE